LKDLIEALAVRTKYNTLPFKEFATAVDTYFDIVVPQRDKDEFTHLGLDNSDYLGWILIEMMINEDKEWKSINENVRLNV